jgi:hypothetical protein
MNFDALGIKILKQQIKQNLELASQQSLKEVSVHSEAHIVNTAKPSEMEVYQPTAKEVDAQ